MQVLAEAAETVPASQPSSSAVLPAAASKGDDAGHCIWYGVCDRDNALRRYCPTNETAKPLSADGLEALNLWCPHLNNPVNGQVNLCCDKEMVSGDSVDCLRTDMIISSVRRVHVALDHILKSEIVYPNRIRIRFRQ